MSGVWTVYLCSAKANLEVFEMKQGILSFTKKTGLLTSVTERSKSVVPVLASVALPVSFPHFYHSSLSLSFFLSSSCSLSSFVYM